MTAALNSANRASSAGHITAESGPTLDDAGIRVDQVAYRTHPQLTSSTLPRMRVLYFALQVPTYPRNSRIRQYLTHELGAEIVVIDLSHRPGFVRHLWELLRDSTRARGPFDVVVLSELSLVFAPLSWFVARRFRAIHLVDFFVGLRETHIEDRQKVGIATLRGRSLVAMEWLAAKSANALLIDTDVRGRALEARYERRAITLPVGAPEWAVMPPPHGDVRDVPRLLYYGNFIPLHGVGTLIAAFALASSDFMVTMIGDGDDRELAEAEVARLGLQSRVTFRGPVPEAVLAQEIAGHEVVLGIFGTSPKAAGVIANKVWQGLYANRIVVTRESDALNEIRELASGPLITSNGESPEEICKAIEEAISRVRQSNRATMESSISSSLEAYVQKRYAQFGEWLGGSRRGRARQQWPAAAEACVPCSPEGSSESAPLSPTNERL